MSSDSQPTSIQEACGQHQHVEPLPDRGAHQEENLEVLVRLNGQWAERAMSTHHTSEWSWTARRARCTGSRAERPCLDAGAGLNLHPGEWARTAKRYIRKNGEETS